MFLTSPLIYPLEEMKPISIDVLMSFGTRYVVISHFLFPLDHNSVHVSSRFASDHRI